MHTLEDPAVAQLSLRPLFGESFVGQDLLDAQHPGQANYVWKVELSHGLAAARTPRTVDTPPDDEFHQGLLRIFDAKITDVRRIAPINQLLSTVSLLPIPQVRSIKLLAGRQFLVLEWIDGEPLSNFDELPLSELERLGRHTALIHQITWPVFGSPLAWSNARFGHPLDQFFPRVQAAAAFLRRRYCQGDRGAAHWNDELGRSWTDLAAPRAAVPVMMDLDPTQFLHRAGTISGLVDTEFYVAAPPELELTAYEVLLPRVGADAFRHGYQMISPMPKISAVRPFYRYLLRLLSFQGPVPWDAWMHLPTYWS